MDGATGLLTASRILGDQVGSTAPVFLAFLAVHVIAGLTAVVTGAIAAVVRKGSPRHIRAGRWFYGAITVLFATATALSVMRWDRLPVLAFWLGPAAIATPLIVRAVMRARHASRVSGGSQRSHADCR